MFDYDLNGERRCRVYSCGECGAVGCTMGIIVKVDTAQYVYELCKGAEIVYPPSVLLRCIKKEIYMHIVYRLIFEYY